MASDFPDHPPGIGVFRPTEPVRFDGDHTSNWNMAIKDALDNFGRAPGLYRADLVLTATVSVTNPGSVVEYIAKFI